MDLWIRDMEKMVFPECYLRFQSIQNQISVLLKFQKVSVLLLMMAHFSQTRIVGKVDGQFLHACWWL